MLLLLLLICLKGFAQYPNPFYPDAVEMILHDTQNIYVAKYDSIIAIDKQSGRKTLIYKRPRLTERYAHDGLTTMSLHEGRLWLGTNDGVIMDYYKGCLTRHEYEGNPTPFSESPISGIAFDSQDRMVVGFYNQVGWIDGNTVTGASEIPSLATEEYIHTMVMDDTDTLWVACTGFYPAGCFSYYTIEKGVSLILEGYDTLPFCGSGPARGLVIDSHRNKWFCVENKLVCFDGKSFKAYELGDGHAWGSGIDVALDNNGTIWVAEWNGQLTRFSESGEWTLFSCGIETKRWFCIDIDGDDIYIGTDHGVLKFHNGVYSELDLTTTSMPNSCVLAPDDDQSHSYDLQGRRLNGEPGKGLYIQNGRKVMVK